MDGGAEGELMSRSMSPPRGGAVIYHMSGRPRRKASMGLYGLVAIALMAGSGALVGGVQARVAQETRNGSLEMLPPGPFSYFPR